MHYLPNVACLFSAKKTDQEFENNRKRVVKK